VDRHELAVVIGGIMLLLVLGLAEVVFDKDVHIKLAIPVVTAVVALHAVYVEHRKRAKSRQTVLRPAVQALPRVDPLPPSFLLRPEYGVVPLRGREKELAAAEHWCQGGPPLSVRLIVGPGGSGKTRFAGELCKLMAARGWVTGFLTHRTGDGGATRPMEYRAPALIVVDYAETRSDLATLIEDLALPGAHEHPIRVVCLARQAGDWWRTLRGSSHAAEVVLAGAAVFGLGPVDSTPAQRRETFLTAARAFARALGNPVPTLQPPPFVGEPYDLILFVHMAALSAITGEQPAELAGATRARLMSGLLRREARYWRASAQVEKLGFADDVMLRRAVVAATLAGAGSEDEATALLQKLSEWPGGPEGGLRRVARWLRRLYPGSDWLNPLEPDVLGEVLVAEVLQDDPHLAGKILQGATDEQTHRILTVLTRAARQSPHVGDVLADLLRANLLRLALPAFHVATQTGEPLGQILTRVLEQSSETSLIGTLLPRIPVNTVALRAAAVVLTGKAVQLTVDPAEKATLLGLLGNRLLDVGRPEEGLDAFQQALAIQRRLLKAGDPGVRAGLAQSLNDMSTCLEQLGQRKEALAAVEEAVAIRRGLAEASPGGLRDLAQSLTNLSLRLATVNRRTEALTAIEEAVGAWHRLAEANPRAYLYELAGSLNNLYGRLADLGRDEQALVPVVEAVAHYRELADVSPDAFLPGLANSLRNLSLALLAVNRARDALDAIEEAVEIFRRLARANPGAFQQDLANGLTSYCNRLCDQRLFEQGRVAVEEALEIWRPLAESNPDAYRPDLARSLHNWSGCLAGLRRRDEALAAIEEAVAIRRQLARADPDAFLPDLVKSLSSWSIRLADLDRRHESLTAIAEAVEIQRQLASAHHEAFADDLVVLLKKLSGRLAAVNSHKEADAIRQEAETIQADRRPPG
jgi:tetratricopeptide (TPR) repeat protein